VDGASAGSPARRARAELQPTAGHQARGQVEFQLDPAGVRVVAHLEGLPPGTHGFHVHERGDCSAPDASSAGEHFNPRGMPHGGPEADKRHAGDLGNVSADGSGKAALSQVDRHLALDGPTSIVGRAVVVHANPDDFTSQPSGAAGARIACGVVQAGGFDATATAHP
jgi:Cu-Zn family superoxide dismutase